MAPSTVRPVKVYQVRRSVAIIILVFQFGCIAALVAGQADLHALQRFDQQRSYDVCVGANLQIQKVIDRLTMPVVISDTVSSAERLALEASNQRRLESRRGIDAVVLDNIAQCAELSRR